VPLREADAIAEKGKARVAREDKSRAALAAGTLGLDMYNMRSRLKELGLEFVETLEDAGF
jgi:4-hydroxy-4-methyl-2-oxoglutarate aldolase